MFDARKTRLLTELIRQCRSDEDVEQATGASLDQIIHARATAAVTPFSLTPLKEAELLAARQHADAVRPLLMRLDGGATLSHSLIARLEALGASVQSLPAKAELQRHGSRAGSLRYLLSGWASRQCYLANGRRQIIQFILPGEAVNRIWTSQLEAFGSVTTLTAVRWVEASALMAPGPPPDDSQLVAALERQEHADEMRMLNHVVRLGQMNTLERLGSFLLEIHDRLQEIGLVKDGSYKMPLTQADLADALGVSVVHVNRTIKELKQSKLASIQAGVVTLLDLRALHYLAE